MPYYDLLNSWVNDPELRGELIPHAKDRSHLFYFLLGVEVEQELKGSQKSEFKNWITTI